MGKAPRFFCESCGAEVAKDAKFCRHCGKFFAAVLCPKCGYSGTSTQFSKGCPSCGYAMGARNVTTVQPQKKQKNTGHLDPLPTWVYAVVACLSGIVLYVIMR